VNRVLVSNLQERRRSHSDTSGRPVPLKMVPGTLEGGERKVSSLVLPPRWRQVPSVKARQTLLEWVLRHRDSYYALRQNNGRGRRWPQEGAMTGEVLTRGVTSGRWRFVGQFRIEPDGSYGYGPASLRNAAEAASKLSVYYDWTVQRLTRSH